MQSIKNSTLKIIFCLVFISSLGLSSIQAAKKAAIVICAETGTILHEQNADALTPPASLAKMMLLFLTFQAIKENRLSYDQHLLVSKNASNQAPCKLWLKAGSTITVRQAILGVVTKSANDAAVTLAEALGNGSESHFAQLMTQQARKLGMSKTIFKNASGLPIKAQITTARDMATLSRSLYKYFPKEFAFFKEQNFTFKGQTHRNHNHLLGKIPGVDGIKTGFINASGFNLAASMVRDNKRIIAVVMGGESARARDKDMVKLLEATHKSIKNRGPYQNSHNIASIGDLIHVLGPSEANASPIQNDHKKAVYLSGKGKVRTLEKELETLDDLISIIDTPSASHKIIEVNSGTKKANAKNKKGKFIKANFNHSIKETKKASIKKSKKRAV